MKNNNKSSAKTDEKIGGSSMLAILGMIPVILVGIIFLVINPLWSALWILLAVGEALFIFKRKRKTKLPR